MSLDYLAGRKDDESVELDPATETLVGASFSVAGS